MSKLLIGVIYVLSLVGLVVGIVLLIWGATGGMDTVNNLGGIIHQPANVPLFMFGLVITTVATLLLLLAWAVTLIKLALLQQWIWLVGVLLFSIIAVPVYLLAGPSMPAPQTSQSGFR